MVGALTSAATAFAVGFSAAWILQAARATASIASAEARASERLRAESERRATAEAIAERVPQLEALVTAREVQLAELRSELATLHARTVVGDRSHAIGAIEPIERMPRKLQAAELLPLPSEAFDGPLI